MRKTLQAVAIASFTVVLLGSQTGCKKLAEKLAAAAAADAGAGAGTTAGVADHDEALDGMVDCLNGLDHSIGNSLDRYESWLGRDKDGKIQGPTGKERVVNGLYDVHDSDVKTCHAGLALAVTKPEFKDIATKLKASTDKLLPEMAAAYKYYDRGEYKDDKFAKAKTIHAKMWPLAEDFLKTSKEFRVAVVNANDARMEKELKEVEAQQGRNLVFQKLSLMKHAKNAFSVGTDEKASLADVQAVTEAYEKAEGEMDAYAKAHAAETAKVMMWSSFTSEAEGYLKALKERVRRVREKTPYSRTEVTQLNGAAGWMVEGSSDKVSHEYNELVKRSNTLHF